MMRQILFLVAALCSIAGYAQADFPEGIYSGAGVVVDGQVKINATPPMANEDATRRDYVDGLDANNVKKTGQTSQFINGDISLATGNLNIQGINIKAAPSFSGVNNVIPLYIGDTPETARSSTFYVNKPVSLTNQGWHAISDYSIVTQTTNGSAYAGFDGRPVINGPGTWLHAMAFQARPVFNGSGTIADLKGGEFLVTNSGTGTVTNGTALSIGSPQNTGGGILTNIKGIDVQNQGASNYAIYTGTGAVRLGDNTSVIGTLSATGIISGPDFSAPNTAGSGYRFFNSNSYKIYMSTATDPTYGGRFGESTSDFNMYFLMSSAINRGFVFKAGVSGLPVASIDYLGSYYGNKGVFTGTVTAASATLSTELATLGQVTTLDGQNIKQNGNSFTSAPVSIGTNNAQDVQIRRNAGVVATFGASGITLASSTYALIGNLINSIDNAASIRIGQVSGVNAETRITRTSTGSDANAALNIYYDNASATGDILNATSTNGGTSVKWGVRNDGRSYGTNAVATNDFVTNIQLTNAVKLENSQTKTASYTVVSTDYGANGYAVFYVNATSGAVTITLDTAANMLNRNVKVIKTDSSANTVTVKGNGSTNINGANTFLLTSQYSNTVISSNGTQYYIF